MLLSTDESVLEAVELLWTWRGALDVCFQFGNFSVTPSQWGDGATRLTASCIENADHALNSSNSLRSL